MCDMQHKGKNIFPLFSTFLHFFPQFYQPFKIGVTTDGRAGQLASPPVCRNQCQWRQQPMQGQCRIPVAKRVMPAAMAMMIIAHNHFFQVGVFLSA